ncbi:potassium-transporting ATPase subunit KdpC [Acinetobacter bohemicus]|uniref:Potassium-transporting ATPase KdpC subunit n=1 Tax=Acinetobacter bohemicus TaxID=1435036 RepID=A0A1I6Q0K0_9GAMM|nr:potassium-transporting ATPase subunit KdpC [Acinetobacter bohemicus]KAB0654055.1 potassium-transporting ATPase subunit KdpC [Acinetobacter bohemicus]SFS45848.1 K+-transporting ATPase ATPase C chain [Acinetobacter bohemicus]
MNTVNTQHLLQPSYASLLRASIGLTIVSLGLCGFLYSATVTGLGQLLFPAQANGSLIELDGKILGSSLVAQPFTDPKYFQPRPSAANYNPMAMAGSNMARTNPELTKIIEQRIADIEARDHIEGRQIPSDLVTASGSGIDPEISLKSAMIQVKRVAEARHLSGQQVIELIQQYTLKPTFGVLGQERINVLELNLALDQIKE